MSWKDKVVGLCKRFGAPTKFAVNLTLGTLLPGSPAVVELILGVLDCVHETAKDNVEFNSAKMPAASAADLQRIEQVLDVLNGDMAALMAQLTQLEQVPDFARKILETALATDDRCRQAAHRLEDLARRFDRLEEQNRQLLLGQNYQTNLLEDLLPLMRRVSGVMDFVRELHEEGLGLAAFSSRLHAFQNAAGAFGRGRIVESEPLFLELAQAQPRSAATAIALAAAQEVTNDPPAAERSLARAVRLRPDDAELKELHRRATVLSRAATPSSRPATTSARLRLKAGDVLDGWRLEQMLGSGGWGQVYKASNGERVRAMKVMHPNLSRDPAFVERFKKEILTLAGLRGHPHLIAIEDFGYATEAACWYFSMEFIDGLTLEQHLRKQGALPPSEACRLFFAVAEGLAAAHARGIVHRDIKPANILLRRPNDKPVLIDFGLAALVEGTGLTETGRSAGYTALFASPEQLRGSVVDARSDVYSLAASFYYALLYDRPDVREPHLFEPEQAPEALRQILTEALHSHPHRRTQTAIAFREALQATLSTIDRKNCDKSSVADMGDLQRAWAKRLGRNVVEEVDLGDGVKMEFVLIPPGKFQMGSPKDEEKDDDDEEQHEVEITRPFYLGKYAVTQEQYEKIVGKNPSCLSAEGVFNASVKGMDTRRFPVEQVSWDDAVSFCRALTNRDGKRRFGLPSEAEWEYACRAGTTTPFHFGKALNGDKVNCNGNYPYGTDEKGEYLERTCRVGSYAANAFGLYDMHGNVWECCQDYYGPYKDLGIKDPLGTEKVDKNARVLRGGSWNCDAGICRAACRLWFAPSSRGCYGGGFRVAFRLD